MNELRRPALPNSGPAEQEIVRAIWAEKYRLVQPDGSSDETCPDDSFARVCRAVYALDPRRAVTEAEAFGAMRAHEWCPGGRIHAGAGSDRRVTLINCYVNETIQDSMPGILRALTKAALTMQQGGGIGQDFSTIRPSGSIVVSTGSIASGPMSFMDMWHAMCGTIMSGGSRRGAMMGTLADWHPDLPAFISAKHAAGRLTNFTVSVLVSDAFMQAVADDGTWDLGFPVPRADSKHVAVTRRNDEPWYVYQRLPARELWERIIRSTYDYAEPGVIFIDRVNATNNLAYCEEIRSTNPCGEQPLPPNGACNLGAINLFALVRSPFTPAARFDYARLKDVTRIGMRFLDNVLDVTNYPLPEQAKEAEQKRRTGLGVMGLGNALQALGLRYGSAAAQEATARIMSTLRDAAYMASAELAEERGPFPLFDRKAFLDRPFVRSLPAPVRDAIAKHGIRNGVLLTIAPTGTTAIYYGNVSSGVEPTFAWRYRRKVLQPDGTTREFPVHDAGWRAYCHANDLDPDTAPTDKLPDHMASALDLPVEDHVRMQAVCQTYIDAAISKTINCPADMSFEDFAAVYRMAYELGCKGCTTYRPSGVRGAVLVAEGAGEAKAEARDAQETPLPAASEATVPQRRPEELEGRTYKLKWPAHEENVYLTINDVIDAKGRRRPYEIFVMSSAAQYAELFSALTLTLSAIMRRTDDLGFLIEHLEKVRAAEGAWVNGKYRHGIVSLIADVIRQHCERLDAMRAEAPAGANGAQAAEAVAPPAAKASAEAAAPSAPVASKGRAEGKAQAKGKAAMRGEICPRCAAPALIRQEGCKVCLNCGHSTC
ncbi:MAG: adenosylcobalamin-dependent ribonucleoside-diphosphate reductase [Alphaproteobacteria bacterium]|nr:adenosylcobalamin-dependent ribonucleoside-diphosphate reductase [Alphaproteobacteria bacterium]